MKTLDDLRAALRSICRFDKLKTFVQEEEIDDAHGTMYKFRFFTNDHVYAVSARLPGAGGDYLGCIVSTRKPRAGESWTRGNDLPDGDFSTKTWEAIKNAIIGYELRQLTPKREYVKDEPVAADA